VYNFFYLALICSSIILNDSDYSDHLPVKVQLGCTPQSRSRFCYQINLNKQESDRLTIILSNTALPSSCNSLDQPEKAYEDLVYEIKHGIELAAPKAKQPRQCSLDDRRKAPLMERYLS